MRRSISVAVIAVVLAAGCGQQRAAESAPAAGGRPDAERRERTEPKLELPPPVVVTSEEARLELTAYTTCWASACMDGVPPDPLPDLGVVQKPVTVTFPVADFTFKASMRPRGDPCAEMLPAELVPGGEGTWALHPAGAPGRYQVDISGNGAAGDVHVSFAMTTTVAGPLPRPTAIADIFWDASGTPRAGGEFDVDLNHLAETPASAALDLTITARDGQVSEFSFRRRAGRCAAPGSVSFVTDAPRPVVRAVGPPPYALRFVLKLDGREYASTVTWPAGMDPETFSIPLEFTPDLPSR